MINIISKLLSFTRVVKNEANVSDVKVDPGGGANITTEHFAPPGDDSFPLPDDYVLGVDVPRSGSKAAAGYIDPKNTPKANEGDKRIYGRKADGISVNEVWLKNDGSVLVSNDNGSILLKQNGDINLNGVIIDTNGNITTPATIVADTIEADTSLKVGVSEVLGHTHVAGTPPGNTGPLI